VSYQTVSLIREAVKELRKSERVSAPRLTITRAELDLSASGVESVVQSQRSTSESGRAEFIPDLLGYLQRETELTRGTIAEILIQSGRLNDVFLNPQEFLNRALSAIRKALDDLMVDGIKYERRDGQEW